MRRKNCEHERTTWNVATLWNETVAGEWPDFIVETCAECGDVVRYYGVAIEPLCGVLLDEDGERRRCACPLRHEGIPRLVCQYALDGQRACADIVQQ